MILYAINNLINETEISPEREFIGQHAGKLAALIGGLGFLTGVKMRRGDYGEIPKDVSDVSADIGDKSEEYAEKGSRAALFALKRKLKSNTMEI
jgi:hypothetical protein